MSIRHIPPAGENMITDHVSSEDCPCKPEKIVRRKRQTTGGFGRQQGYKISETVYLHNPLKGADQ